MSADPNVNGGADPNYVIDPNAAVKEEVEEQVDATALQSQIDELTRKMEHESTLREAAEKQSEFWYEAANKKVTAEAPTVKEEPSIDLSDEEWNAALSDKHKFLGLVDRVATQRAQAIATTVTDAKANQITAEQKRLQTAWATEQDRVPELRDNNHPLTKAFAEKVRAMQSSEEYAGIDTVVVMKLAVREAESEYLRSGGGVKEESEEKEEPAANLPRSLTGQQRSAAIAAQAGSKGRKVTVPDKFSGIPADELALMDKHARALFPQLPPEEALAKIVAQRPRVAKWR